MAITFLEQRKRQKYMIPFLVLTILITFLIIWFGVLKPGQSGVVTPYTPAETSGSFKKVEIDFNFLKSITPEKFQLSETIPAFEAEVGRENPFIPFE
jgi:hypothetical protein